MLCVLLPRLGFAVVGRRRRLGKLELLDRQLDQGIRIEINLLDQLVERWLSLLELRLALVVQRW